MRNPTNLTHTELADVLPAADAHGEERCGACI